MEKHLASATGLLAVAALLAVVVTGAPVDRSVGAAGIEGSTGSSVSSWDWPK